MTGRSSTWVKPRSRDVVDEVLGEVAVATALAPRAEVHLVDAHRPAVRVASRARCCHPVVVAPLVVETVDDRRGAPAGSSVRAGHRVGLARGRCRRRRGSRTCRASPSPTPGTNSSQTPDSPSSAHRVGAAVPVVEVADDVDGLGAGRPDGERRAAHGRPAGRGTRCTWAPRTVHSCSWRPSPMRCRSTSPRVGAKR